MACSSAASFGASVGISVGNSAVGNSAVGNSAVGNSAVGNSTSGSGSAGHTNSTACRAPLAPMCSIVAYESYAAVVRAGASGGALTLRIGCDSENASMCRKEGRQQDSKLAYRRSATRSYALLRPGADVW
jgi:hypothetical protein